MVSGRPEVFPVVAESFVEATAAPSSSDKDGMLATTWKCVSSEQRGGTATLAVCTIRSPIVAARSSIYGRLLKQCGDESFGGFCVSGRVCILRAMQVLGCLAAAVE